MTIAGLHGRDRDGDPIGATHPHLATTSLTVDPDLPSVDAVFLALPHGTAAGIVPGLVAARTAVIDLGPDFRLRDPSDYPTLVRLRASRAGPPRVRGLRPARVPPLGARRAPPRAASRSSASPGCYPTATLLALGPLARAGLIGDLVVDAKSGVSGAGRDAKPDLMFGEVNESVKAYGIDGHRHVAEIEQELAAIGAAANVTNPGASPVDFLPHLCR